MPEFRFEMGFVGRMLFESILLVGSASVLRRECVVKLGGFDPEMRLMEDGDFYVRAIRMFGTYFMDRVVLRYRISNSSLMRPKDRDQSQMNSIREAWRRTHAKYRKERGSLEFFTLALFTRSLQLFDGV